MFDLVTAGEAFDDYVFYDLARLPDPGQEVKTGAFARSPGGGAVITAVAASRLGLRCAVVSGLGLEAVRLLRSEACRCGICGGLGNRPRSRSRCRPGTIAVS